jgi:tetratricopeptide (TPR) repeat protein
LTFGGLLLSAALAVAGDAPPLSEQLLGLGREAVAQGRTDDAVRFFEKALSLDPKNAEAKRALADHAQTRLVARQEPEKNPPAQAAKAEAPATDNQPRATLERAAAEEKVKEQQVSAYVAERLARARDLINSRRPEDALNLLRLTLEALRAESINPARRDALARQVSTQIQATVRAEEELELTRAEALRLAAAAVQSRRAQEELENNQRAVNAMMIQFDTLMDEGRYNVLYNGGAGDIAATTAPFYTGRTIAQQARALEPQNPAPYAGYLTSQFKGFLTQQLAFETLKQFRYLQTLQDANRASVPFPDNLVIEYPPADFFRAITERRIKRYESVSLDSRDEKTLAIARKLDQPVSMPFAAETPLEDVIKYIKSATVSPQLPEGIPIYVDPAGLLEAEKTMTSPISNIAFEGVPLKRSLKLILKQLDLTYTVKDGLLTITHVKSGDQPTEIRVYPVADLAIIPFSLMGGGGMGGMGMGGMGGMGMGGMGGGMGGMGGMGMGGMGGGMGGMGMSGGMGGFMSVPVTAPQTGSESASAFQQKKTR